MFSPSFLPLNTSKEAYKFKVHLTGADPYQWALSEDYKQTVKAIGAFARRVSVHNADIIHSVYWESLKNISSDILKEKVVICNLSGAWDRYETDFHDSFLRIAETVGIWVTRSEEAKNELRQRGLNGFLIPYTVNTDVFHPLPKQENRNLRKKLKIPENRYLIGNFMRDSTAGATCAPKLVKGPDIFADIVTALHFKKLPIHVLLAGPRRHWLRKTLEDRGVPYTYAGYKVGFDDMRLNTLSRKKLNRLCNLLDCSLVTSRSEAGPHAILEAGAARIPQLSTKVGIAPDILPSGNLYDTVDECVALLEKDINERFLRKGPSDIYDRVIAAHTPEAVAPLYRELYERAQQA